MKNLQNTLLMLVMLLSTQVVIAHEGLHAAGQVHAGEHHMGLFEVAIAVIATVLFLYGLLKSNKSKK